MSTLAVILAAAVLFVIAGLMSLGSRRGGACGACPSADRCGAGAGACLHPEATESNHVSR